MNWEAVGAIVEAIGLVGVIASLFYLAVQVRQNTLQARRSELDATLEQSTVFRMALAENQDLAQIWISALDDYDSLSADHKVRFDSLMRQQFWIWFHIHDRRSSSIGDRNHWDSFHYQVKKLLSSPGTQTWWTVNAGEFPVSFREEVKRITGNQDGP